MTSPPESKIDISKIDMRLKKWRERLLDLTKGNPLLGINRSRVSKLLVTEPNTDDLFNTIVVEGRAVKMPLVKRKFKKKSQQKKLIKEKAEEDNEPEYIFEPGDISFDSQPKDLYRIQRRIFDNAKVTVEERGVTTLHLTLGILNWDDPILEESSSPILLVPCQLENLGPNSHMRLKMLDEELRINPALELYLREKHHIDLPQFPEEISIENLKKFVAQIQSRVKEQGWKTEDKIWLSTFSFESLVIYEDLDNLTEFAHVNPLIAALSGAGSIKSNSEAIKDELDELETPAVVPTTVLEADSSQLKALSIAAADRHLVIHGPPGTGKSQTITNLIADALGKGKKVLFVSAKMAALDVVYNRLVKLGLGRFCLEAHSTKAGKTKIIEELKRTLELPINGDSKLLEEQIDELKKVRSKLNDYVKEIHLPREPLGKTIYEVIGRIERLHKFPDIEIDLPWSDVLSVEKEDLKEKLEILNELASQADIFSKKDTHPWRGFSVNLQQPPRQENTRKIIQIANNKLEALLKNIDDPSELIVSSDPEFNIQQLKAMLPLFDLLIEAKGLPVDWQSKSFEELIKLHNLFRSSIDKVEIFQTAYRTFNGITKTKLEEFNRKLDLLNTEFSSWKSIFKVNYWQWKSGIKKDLLPGNSSSFSSLRKYFDITKELMEIKKWFRSQGSAIADFIKDPLRNLKDLKQLEQQFHAAQEMRKAIVKGLIKETSISIFPSQHINKLKNLSEILRDDQFNSAIENIESNWPNGFIDGAHIESSDISLVYARCKELLESMSKMHEWLIFQSVLARCEMAGFGQFLHAIHQLDAKQSPEIFEKVFYSAWLDALLNCNSALREFTGQGRKEKILRFKEIDNEIRLSTLRHIRSVASDPIRNILSAQSNIGGSGEIGILRRELQKRKRIKPLRRLFAEIPNVLQAIKPCMLMSPISVSTFLKPGGISFDLVVFDEASQLPTQESIPSILRAKQTIVAGDENQLPPTTFFWASSIFEGEDYEGSEDDDFAQLESLLNDCVAICPVFEESKLVWHYRSKDERLIKFSNYHFYNNQLITFPSASTSDEGRGIKLIYTSNGTWDRGRSRTNRIEAKKVAEIIVNQFEKFPNRSIGAAAMNAAQKEAIESALDEIITENPDLTPLLNQEKNEPLFVKSLENVQGDERDVIIISIGYAKTNDGGLSLNFGPLNREGGWRRLNVLVTRAKWQTILVTSLRSQELSGINPSNRGALMLRNFIEYAEKDAELPAELSELTYQETNDFEDSIASAIREHGHKVDEQVGASAYRIDLAIRDPRDENRYLLAVECDGATYHSAKTARDRDVLRQEVLESQGWKVYRIWSTDWFRDRSGTLEGLLSAIEVALMRPVDDSVQAPLATNYELESDKNVILGDKFQDSAVHERRRKYQPGIPYENFRIYRKVSSREILSKFQVYSLAEMISDIVLFESPIHYNLLLERLKEVYSISRVGANIERNIKEAIRIAVQKEVIFKDKKFIHGANKQIHLFRTPTHATHRSLEQIADEEIERAILYIIEDQFGFSIEEIPRAVVHLFGINRFHAGDEDRVIKVVDGLASQKQIQINGFMIYLA